MSAPIRIILEASGEVEDTSFLDFTPNFREPNEYGTLISSKLDYLDRRADALEIQPVSAFLQPQAETDDQANWYGYVEGLKTFEPLLTDLISQLGTNDTVADIEALIWDVRVCELILRNAELNCEEFYLCY